MKKTVKYLIIILIVLFITILLIFVTKSKRNKPKEGINGEIQASEGLPEIISVKADKEKNYTEYFTIQETIDRVIEYTTDIDGLKKGTIDESKIMYTKEEMNDYLKNALYYYISKKGESKLSDITNQYINEKYEINNMYVYYDKNISYILVDGLLTNNKIDYPILIVHNTLNYTFIPYEYLKEQFNTKEELLNKFNEIKINEIEDKKTNRMVYINVTEQDMAIKYFSHFKLKVKNSINESYELLNKDYKEAKFNNIQEYMQYISNNSNRFNNAIIKDFDVEYYDEYTKYTCIDQYGNYYVFDVKAVYDYNIMLDTYTIESPEIKEKYKIASDSQKVAYSIQKFLQAVKDKDYKYAYGCLADQFKNKQFKTIEEFERYAQNNFTMKTNDWSFLNFNTIGEKYYSYTVETKNTSDNFKKTFIIELLEDSDFRLSFDI